MKHLSLLAAFILITHIAIAQKATYVLVRHAEKDTSQVGSTMMAANPPLNADGIKRAEKLLEFLEKTNIDSIYSTNFTRALATAQPTATQKNKTIHIYNHRQLEAFANQLQQTTDKTFLIVGHSNTTPILANLLSKTNAYKPLDESVYNQIFIVNIENGKATTNVFSY